MATEKNVLINLLSIARYDHAQVFPVQFMTKGKLYIHEDRKAILEYTESQQDEETGDISTALISLALEENSVTMVRKGDFSNTMVFIPEQRYEGVYCTPYGNMDMAVISSGVECSVGESKGSVHLKYQLNIQGAYASTNELHLEYAAEGSESVQ